MSPRASRTTGQPAPRAGRAVLLALLATMFLAYLPVFGPAPLLRAWAREDGPVESLGAAFFLIAAFAFGAAYRRTRRVGQQSWTRHLVAGHAGYLVLCGLLFVACMEEISWGQRILGLRTPEAIARVNRQKEINLHNLEWFHGHDRQHQRKGGLELTHNMDRLFTVFNLTLGVLIPLAGRRERVAARLRRLGVPVLSLGIDWLFLLNYACSKVLERLASSHAVVEIKECNSALIWTGLALFSWVAARTRVEAPGIPQPAGASERG